MANNIIKRVWNQGSMTPIEDLQGSAFTNENGGHTFQISGVDSNGEALALSGTVAASFLRPDQTTVGISGSVSGGVASVTLSAECYGIPGRFGLVIFLTSDGKKTAIYSCVGNVARSSTDAVAPGVTADVVDLINEIETAVGTIPASYSALMADIAPTYSSSALYAVGDYAWYEGDLKRCIVPITVGETYTPAHWTSAVVGDDVCALKSAITQDDANARKVYTYTSVNLFDYSDCELGDYNSSGIPTSSSTVLRTKKFVQITGTHTISNHKCRRFFYDAGMGFISRSDSANDVDTPANACFVRFTLAKTVYDAHTDVMVNVGTTLLDYQAFSLNVAITDEAKEYIVGETADGLASLKTEFDKLSPYETSVNLFDYSDCELGDFNSSGAETDSTTVMRTKTPVRIAGDYIVSNYNCRKVFYDESLIPLERSASTTDPVSVPSGAKYVRFCIAKTTYDNYTDIMANVGTIIKQYCDFLLYRKIDRDSLANSLYDTLPGAIYKSELYKAFKRVGVCGDSLSVGYSGHTGTYSKIIERNLPYSWPKCIGRDAGAYWLNFGEHGMNVLTWCSSATRGKCQMEAENNKCQMYIICLGVNDSTPTGNRHVDVGTSSDIVDDPDTVATTYYGGFARIIQLIKRKNADARIFCSTIPDEQRSSANRTRYKPYNDAVRYIAGTYYTPDDNVFLLDIASDYGDFFNTKGSPLYIEQVGDDRVSHFSSVGYQMISKIYEDAISKVMLKYQPKFMDIMYIPCDTEEPTEDTMTGYEETDNT